MNKVLQYTILLVILLALGIGLSGCQQTAECPECPECEDTECPEAPECPEVEEKVCIVEEGETFVKAPFAEAWLGSGHADYEAEAFRHWDEEDTPEVPVACAQCHAGEGFQDFVGADGSEAGVVDAAVPVTEASTITCETCHNDATAMYDTVSFLQTYETEEGEVMNVALTGLGGEAVCMTCHQGRQSTSTIDTAITEAGGAEDADMVLADFSFQNMHYAPAAATRYGTEVKGGYEYADQAYDNFFTHVPEADSCTECHDSHTLEVKYEVCSHCHEGAENAEALKDVRMLSSAMDYDGDGDDEEGVYYEVMGMQETLYTAMQAYASEVAGAGIVYDAHTYPYFFIDTNENGEVDDGEAVFPNGYVSWTPRLQRAAHNFQFSVKDPGAYAHGGKYMIQLMYDSIMDINQSLSDPIDLSTAHRDDAGHFAASAEAWRHWDDGGEVEADCAKCHSAEGLPQLAENPQFAMVTQDGIGETVNTPMEVSSGMLCETCHGGEAWPARYVFTDVLFPSGEKLSFGEGNEDANLCLNCHQGNESTVSVNSYISSTVGDIGGDTVSEDLGFRNVHYFAAGATLFGSEAHGGYEYDGKTYVGKNDHTNGFDTCITCHGPHSLELDTGACSTCHDVEDPKDIRMTLVEDYDGDGDVEEGIAGEIETLREALYAGMQAYAAEKAEPLIYDGQSYPYFFYDTDGNGEIDPGEAIYPNQFKAWTPTLLKAAYNFQYATKDTGGYAHNAVYVIELLYDSLQSLNAVPAGAVRP